MGVWRIFPLILYVAAGLAFWGLVSIHHWLAYAASGCILGCGIALLWTRGTAYQYTEFWNCTYPRRMLIIIGAPPIGDSFSFVTPKWYYNGNLPTARPLLGGVIGTIVFTVLAITTDKLFIGFAIMFTITWIAGILLSKRYFEKHKFTTVKDWSKYPPE